MTPRADESLLSRARQQTPADPELRECWRFVVRGLELGWLDDSELRELVAHLRDGSDVGVEELLFEPIGGRLRVRFVDERAECDPEDFVRALAALVDDAARARDVTMTTARALKQWSEHLCIATAAEPSAMIAALATPGAAVAEGGYLVIHPPPLGAKKVMVNGGNVPHVDIRRPGGPLTRADLDAEFGEGRALPRGGAGAHHEVVYQVAVPGAPFRCSVFARFDTAPDPAASVETVILRLDRGDA